MGFKKAMESNFEQIDSIHTRLKHPFTMTVSGSTGAGKSEWIQRLLANLPQMVEGEIGAVIYCFGELNGNILAMQRRGNVAEGAVRVQVHSGLPSEELIRSQAKEWGGRLLVVLDDLMVGMQGELLDVLFTRGSHNWNVS